MPLFKGGKAATCYREIALGAMWPRYSQDAGLKGWVIKFARKEYTDRCSKEGFERKELR